MITAVYVAGCKSARIGYGCVSRAESTRICRNLRWLSQL